MPKKVKLVYFKIFFALVGFSSIVTEIATIAERGRFVPINFFSFFTIESNIFAVIMLIVSAFAVAQQKQSMKLALFRGAAMLYMLITGIVFALLLSGLDNAALTAVPWDNIVLHYIMPVVMLVDWLINKPKYTIRFKQALIWLVYPIVYVAYSLVRGSLVGWYPYPFLNPATKGYTGILLTSIGILGLTLALVWVITRFSSHGKPVTN
jgi:hypothetical protein